MKSYEKFLLALLGILLAATAVVLLLTGGLSINIRNARRSPRANSTVLVDTSALTTAQQLAPLAAARTEQSYAQDAVRLADHAADLAFADALRDAANHPVDLDENARKISERVKTAQATVSNDQSRIAELTDELSKARDADKENVQLNVGLLQARLSLDQDELEDAKLDLTRAGGDKQGAIQQLLDEHMASEEHSAPSAAAMNTGAAPSVELTRERNLRAEITAWRSLRSKGLQITKAQQDAVAREAQLGEEHNTLDATVAAEKEKNKIFLPSTDGSMDTSSLAARYALSFMKKLTQDQQDLSDLDKRIQTEQQIATIYGNWNAFIATRKETFLHRIALGIFWILLIAFAAVLLNHLIQRLFANVSLERRRLHTLRSVIRFVLQALAFVIILLIIFGMPGNFATVIALATAGLTVALKDFIVGFLGWFVLMGKGGIRPGDWVEINGVGGEVIEVGMLHTILLETGSLNEAGQPTGRKVSFVNSFAIEGHYFNFSTSGQWLWDEIEVQIPESTEPYSMAEAIQKIAVDETSANAHHAEEEWNRVTPTYVKKSFSAAPTLSLRPTGAGVTVIVRYITRVDERHEVRARIYRAVVELLHQKRIPESAADPIRS